MKRLIWTVARFGAAAAGLLVWGLKRTPSVEGFAHRTVRYPESAIAPVV